MHFLPYNKTLKEFSRELRSHSTLSEIFLWQQLRASQFRGYSFNRQKPLENHIVDFYCRKLDLVIEIDGDSHFEEESCLCDFKRLEVLEKMGLKFLHFSDLDVKKNIHHVLSEIGYFIDDWEKENSVLPTGFQILWIPNLPRPFEKGELHQLNLNLFSQDDCFGFTFQFEA